MDINYNRMKIEKQAMEYPFAKYYVVPLGKYLATLIKNTPLTPNAVTIIRGIAGLSACSLIYYGGFLNLFLFAIFIQLYHAVDITDGYLAKLKNMKSNFGAWLDGVVDKIVMSSWVIMISIVSNNPFVLFYFVGRYLHTFISFRTDTYFKTEDKLKTKIKSNSLSKMFLFFLGLDVRFHFLSITAIINRLDIFLIFYAIYFNLVWFSYCIYYSLKYIKTRGQR